MAEYVAQDTTDFDHRTWGHQSDSNLEVFSLLATFNCAGICFVVFFGIKAIKSLIQIWKLWLTIMERPHDITCPLMQCSLVVLGLNNSFLTRFISLSSLALFFTLMLSRVTWMGILFEGESWESLSGESLEREICQTRLTFGHAHERTS